LRRAIEVKEEVEKQNKHIKPIKYKEKTTKIIKPQTNI
jgi:hypothetical protein